MGEAFRVRFAIVYVMWTVLRRDRGALVMCFALPALVYSIFAVIFSGASGGDVGMKVVLFDERETPQSIRLVDALGEQEEIRTLDTQAPSDAAVRELVRDLKDTMFAADGAGIAAIQVGRLERIFLIDGRVATGDEEAEPVVFINPKVVDTIPTMSMSSWPVRWSNSCIMARANRPSPSASKVLPSRSMA